MEALQLIFSLIISVNFISANENNRVYFTYKKTTSRREELAISNVTSFRSDFGLGVQKWKSVTVPSGKSYAVGMTTVGVFVAVPSNGNITWATQNVTDPSREIIDIEIFHDAQNKIVDPIIAVVFKNHLLKWYTINVDLYLMEISTFVLDYLPTVFKVFPLNGVNHMLLVNDTNVYSYKFDLSNSKRINYWLQQEIKLNETTKSLALNIHNSDYYLSIPQKSSAVVKIYKLTNEKFVHRYTIKETSCDFVDSFEQGPYSYILTTGVNSSIYRMSKYGPIKQTVLNSHLQDVRSWLVIPIRRYRDEVFILAQIEIHHESHKSLGIEIIHSTGFDFNIYTEIPCYGFGDILYGIDCIVEENPSNGIDGSVILPMDNSIGLIVPEKSEKLSAIVYLLNVDVVAIPNPREITLTKIKRMKKEIDEMQSELSMMRNHQISPLVSSPQAAFGGKNNKVTRDTLNQLRDEILQIKEEVNDLEKSQKNKIDKLILNAGLKVHGKSIVKTIETERINGETTDGILGDIVLNDEIKSIIVGHKIFDGDIKLNDVEYQTINLNNDLKIKGDVVFEDLLEITENVSTTTGLVNEIGLSQEIIEIGKPFNGSIEIETVTITNNLQAENLNNKILDDHQIVDYLEIPGNVTIKNINKAPTNLVLDKKLLENTLKSLKNLNVTGDIKVNYWNGLKFPEDFIFANSKSFDDLTVGEISTNLLNGVKPEDLFTLSNDQMIPGTTKFKEIEITEEFNSTNIDGKYVNDFLLNPTLKESNLIHSKVVFTDLEVDGNVTINNKFNGVDLKWLLDNLIYSDEEIVEINSLKIFKNLSTPTLNVDKINNVGINAFVNKNNNATLSLDKLNGNVLIENLQLSGKLNDVNFGNVLKDSIKLHKNQNISELNLNDIEVDELIITNKLNGIELNDSRNEKEITINSTQKLKKMRVENLIVQGNFSGEINNLPSEDFKSRLNKFDKQKIYGDFYVKELHVDNFKAYTINDESFAKVFDLDYIKFIFKQQLVDGKITVKNFKILGDLKIDIINGYPIDSIFNSMPFIEGEQLPENITFRDYVDFNRITVDYLNGRPFKEFLNNIVFKNETGNIKFNAMKVFTNGFKVERSVSTDEINGIRLVNILRKGNEQIVSPPLIIKGNVVVNNGVSPKYLNGIYLRELEDKVKITDNVVKVKTDMWFNKLAYIDNLIVRGNVNNENLTELFDRLIRIRDDMNITSNIVFNGKVTFKKNFDIKKTLNGLQFMKLYKDIVMKNKDNVIDSVVSFEKPVEIKNTLSIEEDLITDTISKVNLKDWIDNAVWINEELPDGLKFGNVTIANDITVNYINYINMSMLIPLMKEQNITQQLKINNIESRDNIQVDDKVNGLKLLDEYNNTVFNDDDDCVIESPITFKRNVLIYKNLKIDSFVNGRDFNDIVKIHDGLIKGDNLNFTSILVSNITVAGLIDGINLSEWQNNSFRKYEAIAQNFTQPIKTSNLVIKNYSTGVGLIEGLDLRNVSDVLTSNKLYKHEIYRQFERDYEVACRDVEYLHRISKKQIRKFKYLQYFDQLEYSSPVEFFHHFIVNGSNYILTRKSGSCNVNLITLISNKLYEVDGFPLGDVSQMVNVELSDGRHYLASISYSDLDDCEHTSANLWLLHENITITHVQTLRDLSTLQESKIPGTFYGSDDLFVYEYRVNDGAANVYRKWKLPGNRQITFLPPDLNIGLAVKDNKALLKLSRVIETESEEDGDVDSLNVESAIIGRVDKLVVESLEGELAVLKVGKPRRTTMVAVASIEEEIRIKSKSDTIKIYNDLIDGDLNQKISAYKPSSLLSLEFGENGETILMFMEDKKVLQVYEYKGMRGFQHRASVKISADKMIKINFGRTHHNVKDLIVFFDGRKVFFYEIITDGDELFDVEFNCNN